ncbi:MAG: acyl-CoA dehydrogenase family protein [Myxococcales bacterium]|nr:acyl-CoA dehydrogenase family protein [Myxococcales bacterium]
MSIESVAGRRDLHSPSDGPSVALTAAREHANLYSAKAAEHERLGRLSEEALTALRKANLFGLLTPRELGGLEAAPCDALEVFAEVSHADGATGWVLTTCAFAAGLAGVYLSDGAASEVFQGGVPIIAGAGAPNGRARQVADGYAFSGRWSYGSGILHASFTHNGGFMVDAAGEIRRDLGPHIFVAPIGEAQLEDEWNVLGLRGTGSVDYEIAGCVIARGFEHPVMGARNKRGGPVCTIGMAGMSAIAHTGFFLGIGRRVLDELIEVATGGPGRARTLADSESFQEGFGMAEAHYRAARALVFENWRAVEARLASGRAVEPSHVSAVHLAMHQMAWASTAAAEFAYKAGGGVSLRDGPLQRAFRDTLAGRQHIRVSPAVLRSAARDLLAGPKSRA